jgi:hypothetical protein
METTVFLVLNINLRVMNDTSVKGTFTSLESAFAASLEEVKSVDGRNVLIHNHTIEGETTTTDRLTNNLSLGSSYGISYDSYYGSYPCCKMIIPQKIR